MAKGLFEATFVEVEEKLQVITTMLEMMRIVIVAIDGVFMAGFSEVQVIGCTDTIHVSTDDNQDIIQVNKAVVSLRIRFYNILMYSLLTYNHVTYL